jgi:very-short-patch-repair endonuclease
VYRAALTADPDWRAITLAHVFAVSGVAGRRSALALYGLMDPPGEPVVLTRRERRTAARSPAPSTDQLRDRDVTCVDGIPATTPARTLVDSAGRMPSARFEDVLDTAIVQRLVTAERLEACARELWAPRRNGCAIVLALLAERDPNLSWARNVWEAKVAREIRRLRLPAPRFNHPVVVGGRRRYLDVAWPEVKVAVEFDGFVPHSTRRVFDDDRVRQNDLVADGWIVFRVTKAMLDADPVRTFGPVAAAIDGKR